MALIINQSFKEWAISKKYPFTDDSDLTSTDGRRIPLSFVIDASLYPAVEDTYYIKTIDREGITIAHDNKDYAVARFDQYSRGWIPFVKNESVVGSIVLNDDDFPYVVGLGAVQPMTFRAGHLTFENGVVRAFCSEEENIVPKPTFFGEAVNTVSTAFESDRYLQVNGNIYDLSLDDLTITTEHIPISKIVVNGTTYEVHPSHNLTLRAPDWCDTQFITQGDGIILHRRGE